MWIPTNPKHFPTALVMGHNIFAWTSLNVRFQSRDCVSLTKIGILMRLDVISPLQGGFHEIRVLYILNEICWDM